MESRLAKVPSSAPRDSQALGSARTAGGPDRAGTQAPSLSRRPSSAENSGSEPDRETCCLLVTGGLRNGPGHKVTGIRVTAWVPLWNSESQASHASEWTQFKSDHRRRQALQSMLITCYVIVLKKTDIHRNGWYIPKMDGIYHIIRKKVHKL